MFAKKGAFSLATNQKNPIFAHMMLNHNLKTKKQ